MYKVKKRDGSFVEFEIEKIIKVLQKAFEAEKKPYTKDMIEFIALKVTAHFGDKIKDEVVGVEDIQDSVEATLVAAGYSDVAKSYILYRKQRERIRNAKNTLIDYKGVMDGYLKASDWRVKENSTVTYSLGGLILSNSGALTANYWLSEIYDKEIGDAHKNADIHIHDLSMLSGYCAGWSLRQLLMDGLGGVPGKISSTPAAHLSTLCNQMVNFLGIMQNEWAGAQAFSSFDTYLAPFVKVDNLSYKEVKQCIQSFVFGVNTPSRWGCVDTDTEVLSVNGFKKYNELKENDEIYTWKDGKLEVNKVNKVIIKPFKGKLHSYRSNIAGYNQTVTPNHRVLVKKWTNTEYEIALSEDLFSSKESFSFPTAFKRIIKPSIPLLSLQYKYDTEAAADKLQQEILEQGYTTYKIEKDGEKFIQIRGSKTITPTERVEVDYDGLVWCPNVENGTAVFRKDGNVYISGQTQAPFTNVTLDWIVPSDMAELNCIVGGKETDFRYKDCKREMDMVNKALIEIMIEGDANGRGFQYPIPSYNITRDFDWSDTENNRLLFEMTAKYGTPYFSNYINSDMEPSDVRSMCPLTGDTLALYRIGDAVYIKQIGLVYEAHSGDKVELWNGKDWIKAKLNRFPKTKIYEFTMEHGDKVKMGKNHLQPILYNGKLETIMAEDIKIEDYLPYQKDTTDSINELSDEKYNYFRVTKKEEIKVDSDYLYCFETEEDSHLFMLANGLITHNCRLRLDLRELRKKAGGFFGSGESTGSVGVVTINMPRIAYLSTDVQDFYDRLDHVMDLSARSLKIKRDVITQLLEQGLYPYTKKYLGGFDKHFSTIGLIGMNEAGLNANWLKKDMTHKETQTFTKEVLNHMREKLSDYQEMYGDLYNLEATPKMCGGLAA